MPPKVETTPPPRIWKPLALLALSVMLSAGLAGCGGGGSAPGGGEQVMIVPDPSLESPDLIVDSLSASDANPSAGSDLTLWVRVRNAGGGHAPAAALRFYRSADGSITPSDEEVAVAAVRELTAEESGVASVVLRAPSTPGTHHYGACVAAVPGEFDAANNCSPSVQVTVPAPQATSGQPRPPAQKQPQPPAEEQSRETPPLVQEVWKEPLAGPDLLVESPSASDANPGTGADFTLSVRVRNAGSGTAEATTLRFYRSTDSRITIWDTELGHVTVPGLAAAKRVVASFALRAPSEFGTYYYGACVAGGGLGEYNFWNNCSPSVRVTVKALGPPDIEFSSFSVSNTNPAVGGIFSLHAVLRNAGRKSGAFWLRYYRSDDATFTASDPQVAANRVGGISRRGSYGEYEMLDTPDDHGTYYYRACADAPAGESDTADNCSAAVKIEVNHSKPNLRFSSWGPGKWKGNTFPMVVTLLNSGGPSEATTLRFYRSTDREITPSDTEVASIAVPALKEKDASIGYPVFDSGSVYVPVLPTGRQYYGACVDPPAGESDTTDNCQLIWIIKR